jgi:hypothetical protein
MSKVGCVLARTILGVHLPGSLHKSAVARNYAHNCTADSIRMKTENTAI